MVIVLEFCILFDHIVLCVKDHLRNIIRIVNPINTRFRVKTQLRTHG